MRCTSSGSKQSKKPWTALVRSVYKVMLSQIEVQKHQS